MGVMSGAGGCGRSSGMVGRQHRAESALAGPWGRWGPRPGGRLGFWLGRGQNHEFTWDMWRLR